MEKLTKKIIYLFSFIIISVGCFSNFVFSKSLAGYVIDNYDINIKVNENNTFDITEKINVNFLEERHGIFRTIPLSNKVYSVKDTNLNRAKVKNISVNSKFKTSIEDKKLKIKIGDANKYLTGNHEYVIKYNYNIGKDSNKRYDEFYYNIIGNEWDASIKNYSFTITLPKDFDEQKLGFSTGRKGIEGTDGLTYVKEGNVIKGQSTKSLSPREAVTVRLELPEGYFVNAGHKIGITDIIYFIIPIGALAVSIYIWYKYGKDDEVIETIEFYPPEGLNSLEIGSLYKGEVCDKHIISLLVYLANKGYIKIIEKEKKLFKNSFEIEKLKEYDGNNESERLFLLGLFKKSKEKDGKIIVESEDLKTNFYTTLNKIKDKAKKFIKQKKIFETLGSEKKLILIGLLILTIINLFAIPAYEYGLIEDLIGFLLMLGTIFISLILPVIATAKLWVVIMMIVFLLPILIPLMLLNPASEAIMSEPHYFVGFCIGIISVILMIVIMKLMQKRSKYGNEILGKIRGFKTFLETAEKEKLEMMVLENPTYFYDILPYTYVLDISSKWIKKFESINVEPPTWYESSYGFRVDSFGNFIDSTMSSAQSVMTSTPASSGSGYSGGGISSGGGFSGGGSGGGGGGSW